MCDTFWYGCLSHSLPPPNPSQVQESKTYWLVGAWFFHDCSSFFESIFHMFQYFPYVSICFRDFSLQFSLPIPSQWPDVAGSEVPMLAPASDRLRPRHLTWPWRRAAGGGESRCGTAGWQCQSHAWQVPMKTQDKTMIWIWYEYDMNMMEYQIYIYSTHTSYTYIMYIYIW